MEEDFKEMAEEGSLRGRPPGPPDPLRHEAFLEEVLPLKLHSKHRLLMRLLVSGLNQTEAGLACGYSPARIGQLLQSELFSSELEAMRKEVEKHFIKNEANVITACKQRLMQMADKATMKLEGMMDSESEQVKLRAVESVLDRVGLQAVERIEQSVTVNAPEGLTDALRQFNENDFGQKKEKIEAHG